MSLFNFESSICRKCNKLALNDVILCSLCNTWLHAKCMNITKSVLRNLSNSTEPYYCQMCISLILPFYNITNLTLIKDTFNSSLNQHIHKKPKCFNKYNNTASSSSQNKCFKCNNIVISTQNKIICTHCNHTFHIKCANLSLKSANDNRSSWLCKECNTFPYNSVNQLDFEITDPTKKTKKFLLTMIE